MLRVQGFNAARSRVPASFLTVRVQSFACQKVQGSMLRVQKFKASRSKVQIRQRFKFRYFSPLHVAMSPFALSPLALSPLPPTNLVLTPKNY
jgi:hypothetical protein